MFKKSCCMIILYSMFLSNIIFNLTSVYSIVLKQNSNDFFVINLYSQYNVMRNIPKIFVKMCVQVEEDIKSFNLFNNKISNIVIDKQDSFSDSKFAFVPNYPKFKVIKIIQHCAINDTKICNLTNMYYLFMIILMFYLIGYIGLLRLFNANYFINNYLFTPKTLPRTE